MTVCAEQKTGHARTGVHFKRRSRRKPAFFAANSTTSKGGGPLGLTD
jgi:hypothetical protein